MSADDVNATPLAPVPSTATSPPPHPLDAQWHLHQNDQVYGPYTGHDLKRFVAEGIVDASSNVVRIGREDWKKAGEDPALSRLFQKAPPPPASITAKEGATIVQVTNQITSPAYLDDGEFGPKSAGLALVLSLLICGGGQMYNGQVAKGVLMLIGCVILWFMLLGWIINIWSWVDAYQTAKKMNARYRRRLAAGQFV